MHDGRSGALLLLQPRTFALIACADGTRDLEGVALEASRRGVYGRRSEIEAALAELDAAGLLDEGVEPGPELDDLPQRRVAPLVGAAAARSLEALPGYGFRCTGSGDCCSQYATIALTAADARRAARAGLDLLPDDPEGERVYLPLVGAVRTERLAMTLVDGRCLQLGADGRCGLEARGGPEAKPAACRAYPATLVDDGSSVRVSVTPECGCVFASLDGASTEPLVLGSVGADLPAGVSVRVLPARVAVARGRTVEREEVAAWSREAAAAAPGEGLALSCVTLGRHLEDRGLGAWPSPAGIGAVTERVLAEEVARIGAALEAGARSAEAWRSAGDRTRRVRRAAADTAAELASSTAALSRALADESRAGHEALVVRAALFGHALVGEQDLSSGLRALGAKLLVARALGAREGALGHPLAATFAAVRGITG